MRSNWGKQRPGECGQPAGPSGLTQALLLLVSEPLVIWAVQDLGLLLLRDSHVCMWSLRKLGQGLAVHTHSEAQALK